MAYPGSTKSHRAIATANPVRFISYHSMSAVLRLLSLLVLCFSAPLAFADSACSSQQSDEVSTIRYIHDGDTLHLKDGRKIRLIGINTPELARDSKPAEPFAVAATNALKALFKDDKSIALLYGKDRQDHYGRYLAHALLTDGQNVQAILLKQGLAQVITIPPNTRFATCYLEIEHQARCGKAGLWQTTNIVAADQLHNSYLGFHLVQGKVEKIRTNDKGIWLDIDHQLTVGIRPENQALFDKKTIDELLHQTVIVRGWINKSDKTTPYYVRIRHPLSIQLAESYSCH
jgi:endonuclease YncB( thermonuclease family)